MKAATSILLADLVLGACGKPTAPPQNSAKASLASTTDNGGEAATTLAFPEAFRGAWGLAAADCGADGPRTGRMVIGADTIRFYESAAQLTAVDGAGPLTATLAFEGEGERWTRRTRFTLGPGGTSLQRRDADAADTLRYWRCDNQEGLE